MTGSFAHRLLRKALAPARLAPSLCVACHVVALVMMAVYLRPATLLEPDALARARYVAAHPTAWTIGWATWMASAASYVGFCAWWGARLTVGQTSESATRGLLATLAVMLAAFGMFCDFTGEGALVLLLPEHAAGALSASNSTWDSLAFVRIEHVFTLLSPGAANGLYTIAGILLTLLTPNLPAWVRAAMWITWLAGIGMTVAALAGHVTGMVISTAVLFPPFLVWVAWTGACWPAASLVERSRP